jgi:transcriptional regulator with XRE-family HTH domain
MEFKDRLTQARTKHWLSQNGRASSICVQGTNISRYERGENRTTTDVLSKLANALGPMVDFLMKGTQDEVVAAQLSDKELLKQFRQVEQLNAEDKNLVKVFIDAFLTKRQLQQLAQ